MIASVAYRPMYGRHGLGAGRTGITKPIAVSGRRPGIPITTTPAVPISSTPAVSTVNATHQTLSYNLGLPDPTGFRDQYGAPLGVHTVNGCPIVNLADDACDLYGNGNLTPCSAIVACDSLTGQTHGIDPGTGLPLGPNPASETHSLGMNAPGCNIPGVPCFAGGVTNGPTVGYGINPQVVSDEVGNYSSIFNAAPSEVTAATTIPNAHSGAASNQGTGAPTAITNILSAVGSNGGSGQPGGMGVSNSVNATNGTMSQPAGMVVNNSDSGRGFDFTSILEGSTFGIPNWMLGAGALVVAYMMTGRH